MCFPMHPKTRSRTGSHNCCHGDEALFWDTQRVKPVVEMPVVSTDDRVTSTATRCCGLVPTCSIEGRVEFELDANANNCYFPPFTFWIPWILSTDPIRVHRLQKPWSSGSIILRATKTLPGHPAYVMQTKGETVPVSVWTFYGPGLKFISVPPLSCRLYPCGNFHQKSSPFVDYLFPYIPSTCSLIFNEQFFYFKCVLTLKGGSFFTLCSGKKRLSPLNLSCLIW